MDEEKLTAFQREVAHDVAKLNSELLRQASEIDWLKAQLNALREVIEKQGAFGGIF